MRPILLGASALALATSCASRSGREAGPRGGAGSDSLQGTIAVVGVDALPRVVIRPADGGPELPVIGSPVLRRLSGLGVTFTGHRTGNSFTVETFHVTSANGVSATDGRLVSDGGRLALVTADGVHHPLVNPSPTLLDHVGGRVWLSGPLDREPVAYGVIE